MLIRWDFVSELRLLSDLLFIPQMIYEHGYGGIILTGETEELRENLSQCHFVHHKSHMHWPGRDTGPPGWEPWHTLWLHLLKYLRIPSKEALSKIRLEIPGNFTVGNSQYTEREKICGNIRRSNSKEQSLLGKGVVLQLVKIQLVLYLHCVSRSYIW
jgi:hypothetical protein